MRAFYFAKVVEHQGFAPAGRALGVPKSKLSRRIALLEGQLGVRLIQRSTRRFSVTPLGQNYYAHCAAMLAEAEAAQRAIEETRAEPAGLLRMTCPIALLHARIGQMVADFMVRHPRVTVHLEATNRTVDVIGEGVDVAIRVRPPPLQDSELAMRVLTERVWSVLASPAMLESFGPVATLGDLGRLPTLDLGPPQPEHAWQLEGPGGAGFELRHFPRLVTDDMTMLRAAGGRRRRRLPADHDGERAVAPGAAGQALARLGTQGRHRACGVSVPAWAAAIGAGTD